ncbi:unnamed protein product [Cylicocyclus nassatus]|uniref:Uncharacterized protein n=1 Tax=Cylicocyclus nassatus TaxID=53992 RepID=A0AA36MH97_CYLNA|nr:unnamed protein product [Cylicocyclus nassatus]
MEAQSRDAPRPFLDIANVGVLENSLADSLRSSNESVLRVSVPFLMRLRWRDAISRRPWATTLWSGRRCQLRQ